MARGGKSVPTVVIVGPQGRLIINECDLPAWRDKGYRVEGEPQPQGGENPGGPANPEEPVPGAAGPPKDPVPGELESLTVPELRAKAQQLGLSGVGGTSVHQMKRSELVEALRAVGK